MKLGEWKGGKDLGDMGKGDGWEPNIFMKFSKIKTLLNKKKMVFQMTWVQYLEPTWHYLAVNHVKKKLKICLFPSHQPQTPTAMDGEHKFHSLHERHGHRRSCWCSG